MCNEIQWNKKYEIEKYTHPSITLCACFSVHCGLGHHVSGISNWWSAQFCPQSSGKVQLYVFHRLVECMSCTFNRKNHQILFAFTGIFPDLKRKKTMLIASQLHTNFLICLSCTCITMYIARSGRKICLACSLSPVWDERRACDSQCTAPA